ncbi:MAG: hypothetical protein GY942_23180, partial [Aestuariibacter sp.]|nr:hypothetical protein [Aestuariibacter sp.]
LEYQAGDNGYGGAVFEFDAVDLSAYDTLTFTIDTSGITDFTNLTVQMEPPTGGTAGGNVLLGSYTPVATSGNWRTYEIPFADFNAVTFTGVTKLGFFNLSDSAGLTTGTIFLDDINFALLAHECVVNGGGNSTGELAINGGFDSNFTGWAQYPSAQTTQEIIVDPTTSSNVARIFIPAIAGGVNNVLKQERLEDGNGVFSSGDVVNISFDYRGEEGEGILFVKSICETASGTCGDLLHNNGAPFTPTANWTSYSDSIALGADVTGYTLEFAAVCGGTGTCIADYFIDNVSISIAGIASRPASRHYCETSGGDTEPTVAAPTPTEDAGNVISIFSDAYTDVTGVDYNPAWGQAT